MQQNLTCMEHKCRFPQSSMRISLHHCSLANEGWDIESRIVQATSSGSMILELLLSAPPVIGTILVSDAFQEYARFCSANGLQKCDSGRSKKSQKKLFTSSLSSVYGTVLERWRVVRPTERSIFYLNLGPTGKWLM